MKRHLLILSVGLLLAGCAPQKTADGPAGEDAGAAAWPTKPITISCFAAAGGGTDTVCRLVAKELEQELGVKVNVVNRAGARGGEAIRYVWSRKHDGYNWGGFSESMLPASVLGVSETTAKDWNFFMVAGAPGVISVKADSEIKDLADLVARLQAKPKSLRAGASLAGGIWHTKLLALQRAAGVEFQFIPYKGSQPSQLAALSGEVDVALTSISEQAELIRGGRLRPLAMIEAEGFEFPDRGMIPSAAEDYPDISQTPVSQFLGVALPADAPTPALRAVSAAFEKLMQSEELKSFADQRLLTLLGEHGEAANAKAIAAERAWTWLLHELKIAVKSPADLGIAKPE